LLALLLTTRAWADDSLERLQCGVPMVRQLESGEADSFHIRQPGDRVLVEAIDISGRLGLLKLSLADEPDVTTCSGMLPLPRGVAEVEVSDCIPNLGDDEVGQYTISMSVISQSPGNCGVQLPCGAALPGQLAVRGEVDSFVFPASDVGGEVKLKLGGLPADAQTFRMRVFDPEGLPVDGGDSCDGSISIRPNTAGLYTVLVSACAKPVSGAYNITWTPAACPVTLDVVSATSAPGQLVRIPVRLHTGGQSVAATQNDLFFDENTPIVARMHGTPDCVVNPDINKTASAFVFQPAGCNGNACNGVHAIIFATDNSDPIEDGATLFTCNVSVAPTAAPGSYSLRCANALASSGGGGQLLATCSSGEIVVSATPCPGDCDGSGHVTVDELVMGVNIALGLGDPLQCRAFDSDGDGRVSVDELVTAVNSALIGCDVGA